MVLCVWIFEGRNEMAKSIVIENLMSDLVSLRYDLVIALKHAQNRDRDGKLADLCRRMPKYVFDVLRWVDKIEYLPGDALSSQVGYLKDLFGEPTMEVMDVSSSTMAYPALP